MTLRIVVTGAKGFIGKHLCKALHELPLYPIITEVTRDNWESDEAAASIAEADVVFHLAGTNRAEEETTFYKGNVDTTIRICELMDRTTLDFPPCVRENYPPLLVYASSLHADRDDWYGKTKLRAEQHIKAAAENKVVYADIVRLPNVFGPGALPFYNSFAATCCYRAANGQPTAAAIDGTTSFPLCHVRDVVSLFMDLLFNYLKLNRDAGTREEWYLHTLVNAVTQISAFDLVALIQHIQASVMSGGPMPDMSSQFMRDLYTTYLSYVPFMEFEHGLTTKSDARGWLTNLMASPQLGQIFTSSTIPGVTRGGHYHTRKVEKFFVLHGTAELRLVNLETREERTFGLTGNVPKVVDVPPWHVHWLTNTGGTPLIAAFWSSEPFDEEDSDTYMYVPIQGGEDVQ